MGTTKNTAMYVDKFLECRQTATESIQKYAGRLRLLAIEAYPKSTPDESFMIHQFIRGLKLDRISRNMINTTQPATLNEAIAIASRITTESLEVHFAETSKQTTQYVRQAPYKGRATRDMQCFNCKLVGHMAAQCRKPPRSTVTCSLCNRRGHFRSQCTSTSQYNTGIRKCQLCNNVGHSAPTCCSVKFTTAKPRNTSGGFTFAPVQSNKTTPKELAFKNSVSKNELTSPSSW